MASNIQPNASLSQYDPFSISHQEIEPPYVPKLSCEFKQNWPIYSELIAHIGKIAPEISLKQIGEFAQGTDEEMQNTTQNMNLDAEYTPVALCVIIGNFAKRANLKDFLKPLYQTLSIKQCKEFTLKLLEMENKLEIS
ncbi:hypothetical protein D5R81_16960 [Parashewanella spongiae]|uniref:Uncharacterized protein n=1 Tax=Parashewanella spongiae TaxID=342950 RepID=A0A3A6TZG2_9GAMM|nr:hypothetical protein [Parashewanella spongiae]MCL1079629.1 hypothetical protein [Parashewanella spongiae]RJY06983.1 hypothetical protein D5R81_16960 [Parashewanella spongiae]